MREFIKKFLKFYLLIVVLGMGLELVVTFPATGLIVVSSALVLTALCNTTVKVKYFNDTILRIRKIPIGDWVDLRASERVELKAGEFKFIPLGVGMILPKGYEAIIAPRGSTFKNFGVIQANSIGVVDNSFNGDADEWKFPAVALRDTVIEKNERICQFRIVKSQPKITFRTVLKLNDKSRGGFGSTGKA